MTTAPSPRQPNPYHPGFNQAPLVFAGRTDVLDAANEALEVAAFDGRTARPLILVGPRGVGKTVTLGEISHAAAEQLSWPTVHVEAKRSDLIGDLTSKLRAARELFEGITPTDSGTSRRVQLTGAKVQASILGIGRGVEVSREEDSSPESLGRVLRSTMTAAMSRDAGLLVTLDELQNATATELHELGGVLQETVPENWPLVIAVAALPSLREKRGKQLPTYLERAEWHPLESLAGPDAREALTAPAGQSGRPMDPDAADHLIAQTGGYPYAIQVAGHFAWRASHGSDRITGGTRPRRASPYRGRPGAAVPQQMGGRQRPRTGLPDCLGRCGIHRRRTERRTSGGCDGRGDPERLLPARPSDQEGDDLPERIRWTALHHSRHGRMGEASHS